MRFSTPEVEITEELRASAVRLGGFTHPLFTRPDEVSLPAGSPLPGQAVLLLMGGLVEQTDRLDDAIALLGMTDVVFHRPAVPGRRLHVDVAVLSRTARASGRGVQEMTWSAVDDLGTTIVTATVRMLVRNHVAEEPHVQ